MARPLRLLHPCLSLCDLSHHGSLSLSLTPRHMQPHPLACSSAPHALYIPPMHPSCPKRPHSHSLAIFSPPSLFEFGSHVRRVTSHLSLDLSAPAASFLISLGPGGLGPGSQPCLCLCAAAAREREIERRGHVTAAEHKSYSRWRRCVRAQSARMHDAYASCMVCVVLVCVPSIRHRRDAQDDAFSQRHARAAPVV